MLRNLLPMCVRFNNLFYVSLLEKFAQIKNNKKKRNAETIKGKKKRKKKMQFGWHLIIQWKEKQKQTL